LPKGAGLIYTVVLLHPYHMNFKLALSLVNEIWHSIYMVFLINGKNQTYLKSLPYKITLRYKHYNTRL